MNENFLLKIIEHNNWANLRLIEACYALTDEQLDAEPQSVTKGSIRETLLHLVRSQKNYLRTLTLPLEERLDAVNLTFTELKESAQDSGEGLLALARGEQTVFGSRLRTRDGYYVDPWVMIVQVINHASEHREQIKSMMTALGITPPEIDGWQFGEETGSLVPLSRASGG